MSSPSLFPSHPSLPTSLLARLPQTPLILAALAHTRAHSTPTAYNHVLRSWLFAATIYPKIPSLSPSTLDAEVVALSAIMHDLGWDPTGSCVSADKRFEVDGADAAVAFLAAHAPAGGRKTQQVWDAIALHTVGSVAFHKEPPVAAAAFGIWADFQGPDRTDPAGILTWDEYDAITKAYPRRGLMSEVKEVMCGFCRTKPATTYYNTVGEWGEMFVEGYSRDGHRTAELLLTCDLDEREV
ncbi:hypothetical protein B0J12DRAFT_721074 [Macrophomina phaseolina]|uniref:HD domain-containing protein n=1 Tax=Macrophomina phaseolina TaxID=35725 RepID=A0ABQ8FZR7_9PEZI|nr:hypothetical protein B0J12DRAFT_721074 [Macrophomina phaseolina]